MQEEGTPGHVRKIHEQVRGFGAALAHASDELRADPEAGKISQLKLYFLALSMITCCTVSRLSFQLALHAGPRH